MGDVAVGTVKSYRSGPGDLGARHNALLHPYDLEDNELLSRQRQRESNARSYPRRIPIAISRARGMYIEDTQGRVYLDCLACAGTLALGHNHPVVVEALLGALREELPMQTLDLMTPVKDRFVQDVLGLLPASFAERAKVQFCGPTGTDAVEAALKLVKTATKRPGIAAFHGAYHGMSQGALSLMGNLGPKRHVGGVGANVQFLPYPYDFRCPFGLGGEAGERSGLHYIKTVLSDPESGVLPPAALILEAVQGEGGVIPASNTWLRGLRELTTQVRVPLIIDEVQTGLGRTGAYFAFQHSGITPDVLVLSKAIGGGLPLSIVVYDKALDTWGPGAHAGTFRGNQLAMVTGSATIRFVQNERLDQRANVLGARLTRHLEALRKQHSFIGDVRGRGLMVGLEIVDTHGQADARGTLPTHGELALAIQGECLRRGLILEVGGRDGSTLRLLPPLIISEAQIDYVAEILAVACVVAARACKRGA